MRITFACLIIGSFVALSAKAVEDVEGKSSVHIHSMK